MSEVERLWESVRMAFAFQSKGPMAESGFGALEEWCRGVFASTVAGLAESLREGSVDAGRLSAIEEEAARMGATGNEARARPSDVALIALPAEVLPLLEDACEAYSYELAPAGWRNSGGAVVPDAVRELLRDGKAEEMMDEELVGAAQTMLVLEALSVAFSEARGSA